MFFKRFMLGKGKAVAQASDVDAATLADAAEADVGAVANSAGNAAAPEKPKFGSAKVAGRIKRAMAGAAPASAIDAAELGFKTTAELTPSRAPVGQEKALEALTFGASMKGSGYHILVTGDEGIGRRTATRTILRSVAADMERPTDWVYVNAFETDGGFRALKLPAGKAKPFAEKMAHAIDQLAVALPAAFAAVDYDLKRRMIEEEQRFAREDALEALRHEAEAQNIALLRTPAGFAVAPMLEGKVVKTDVFNSIPEAMRREVETKIAAVEAEMEAILAERPEAENERRARIAALGETISAPHVNAALADMQAEFGDIDDIANHLEAVSRDLIGNAGLFIAQADTNTARGTNGASSRDGGTVRLVQSAATQPRLARYAVHVMSAAASNGGAPVTEETNPSYSNLFGRVELAHDTDGHPRVVRVRPGALHRANNGFLLLEAAALLSAGAAVEALQRALEGGEIRFDPPTDPIGVVGDEIPDLEPIPLNVKLVLIADDAALTRLKSSNPGLMRAFKAKAKFLSVVEKSPENITKFARLVAYIVEKHDLRAFEAEAVAMLIDEAAKRAEKANALAMPVSHLVDLCRAADHWADNEDRKTVAADDVAHALRHTYDDATGERETRRATMS